MASSYTYVLSDNYATDSAENRYEVFSQFILCWICKNGCCVRILCLFTNYQTGKFFYNESML